MLTAFRGVMSLCRMYTHVRYENAPASGMFDRWYVSVSIGVSKRRGTADEQQQV